MQLSERDRTLFRRRHIGFIFQFFNLLPTLTVLENLLLPLELKGAVSHEDRPSVRWSFWKPSAWQSEPTLSPTVFRAGSVSGWQSRGLWCTSPTSSWRTSPPAISTWTPGLEVIELLDRLTRRAGKTLVMATHSREVVGVADRIFTIEHGRLVEHPQETPR